MGPQERDRSSISWAAVSLFERVKLNTQYPIHLVDCLRFANVVQIRQILCHDVKLCI